MGDIPIARLPIPAHIAVFKGYPHVAIFGLFCQRRENLFECRQRVGHWFAWDPARETAYQIASEQGRRVDQSAPITRGLRVNERISINCQCADDRAVAVFGQHAANLAGKPLQIDAIEMFWKNEFKTLESMRQNPADIFDRPILDLNQGANQYVFVRIQNKKLPMWLLGWHCVDVGMAVVLPSRGDSKVGYASA